jgi:hypothetical protein
MIEERIGKGLPYIYRWVLQNKKPLNQGFLLDKLKSSLRKFYDYQHDSVKRYGIPVP